MRGARTQGARGVRDASALCKDAKGVRADARGARPQGARGVRGARPQGARGVRGARVLVVQGQVQGV